MSQWHPLSQATRFQRTAWMNAFSVCSAMQLNGKEILENSLNQSFWLTDKDKQGYLTWVKSCLQTTENLQFLIDKSFQEVEKHLSDQPPAASASAKKKSTLTSLILAAAEAAPKAVSPAKKKAPSKRSTTGSKSTSVEQVKKETVNQKKTAASTGKSDPAANKTVASTPKKRGAATKTAKKTASTTKTAESTQRSAAPTAKPAASQQTSVEQGRTAEKQAPAKSKESSATEPKPTA